MHEKAVDKEITKTGASLSALFLIYTALSYLIFLRDDFILERISILTDKPGLLTIGRQLAKILHVNSIPTPLFFITVMLMFIVYIKTLRILKSATSKDRTNKIIVFFTSLYLLITIFSFPSLSTDVFDYISSNRVLFVHNSNPWIVPPETFPEDEFIYLGSWKFRPSVYGPVQFIFSSTIHLFAGENLIANIIGFKIIHLTFVVATIIMLIKWFKENSPSRLAYGIVFFAWNPLLLIEIVGNAHNDIIMAFFTLLSVYWLSKNQEVKASLSLALAVLAKIAAIIYIPIIILNFLINNKKKKAILFSSTSAVFTILGFLSLRQGLFGLIKNLNTQLELYLRSLPTIIRFIFIKLGLDQTKANMFEKLITLPLFSLMLIRAFLKKKFNKLIESMVVIMLLYFLIAAPMLQPWYIVWILPLAALMVQGRLQNVILVFTLSSLLHYSVLHTSFYFSPLNFIWQILMFSTIVIPPVLIWILPKNWYTRISKLFLIS